MSIFRSLFLSLCALTAAGCQCNQPVDPEAASEKGEEAGQTFEQGMQLLCDSPKVAKGAKTPEEKGVLMSEYANQHLTNAKVRRLLGGIESMSKDQKYLYLRKAAQEAKIQDCLLLKSYTGKHAPEERRKLKAKEGPAEGAAGEGRSSRIIEVPRKVEQHLQQGMERNDRALEAATE